MVANYFKSLTFYFVRVLIPRNNTEIVSNIHDSVTTTFHATSLSSLDAALSWCWNVAFALVSVMAVELLHLKYMNIKIDVKDNYSEWFFSLKIKNSFASH